MYHFVSEPAPAKAGVVQPVDMEGLDSRFRWNDGLLTVVKPNAGVEIARRVRYNSRDAGA